MSALLRWPELLLACLQPEGRDMWQRLMANLGHHGITLGAFYSGLLTPELGLLFVARALENEVKFASFRRAWACDSAPAPQVVHAGMAAEHQCEHHCGDLKDFLSCVA